MASGQKYGGRVKGTPNKATVAFKETVTALLDENRDNVSKWLKTVAEGDADNQIKPDPGKALSLVTGLAEYAYPKLARTEITGDPAKPIHTVSRIELIAPKNVHSKD